MLSDSFIDYLTLEKKYSKHTITAYKNDLESFSNFLNQEFYLDDLLLVNYNHIRAWISSLVDLKISNNTINRKISSLKAFYKFLQKIHEIEVSPLKKHKALKTLKKVQVPFSQKELNEVITNLENKEDFKSIRDKLMVELFYSTGLRRIELIQIKEADIDLNEKTIKVLGKRNKERFVPLLSSVKETLTNYLRIRKKVNTNSVELFITEKGNKVYETLVYRVINSYFSKVSSKVKKSPHILRHSFATHLLNEGANLNSVKELLGHSSLASTQVYVHNSLGALKKVYNQAHPRSNKKSTK